MSEQEKKSSLIEESRRVRSGSKKIYWIVGVLVVIIPFLIAVTGGDEEVITTVIETEKVEKGDIVLSVSTSGRVIPLNDIDLQFINSGVLKELFVVEGQEVVAGDVIAKLDTQEAYLALAQARSSLESAEANLVARTVGGTDFEIELQEELVVASELSLASSQADLANKKSDLVLKESQVERDLENEYKQLLIKLSMTADVLDNALHDIDVTFGIDSDSVLNGGEDDLGILNSRYRSDVDVNYLLANNLFEDYLVLLNIQKNEFDVNVTAQLLTDSITLSKAVNQAVQVTLNTIEASFPTGKLTQGTIDSLKSDFIAHQNRVKSEVLALALLEQDIADLHIDGQEDVLALKQDITDLELKVQSSQQSITIANAQLNLKTEDVSDEVLAPYRAQVTQAKVSVDLAIKKYNDLIIKAPFDGVISELNYRVGEFVGNEPVAVVSNEQGLTVEVYVEEADVASIDEGQDVVLSFDAIEDLELEGIVTFISPKSTIDGNGIVTYKVLITGVETNDKVREGMTTYADIISSGVRDVLVIPVAAVKPRDGKPSVQLADGSWTPVVTGFTDGKSVEVISGIKRGDTIQYER